jgi:hypothetical protein
LYSRVGGCVEIVPDEVPVVESNGQRESLRELPVLEVNGVCCLKKGDVVRRRKEIYASCASVRDEKE